MGKKEEQLNRIFKTAVDASSFGVTRRNRYGDNVFFDYFGVGFCFFERFLFTAPGRNIPFAVLFTVRDFVCIIALQPLSDELFSIVLEFVQSRKWADVWPFVDLVMRCPDDNFTDEQFAELVLAFGLLYEKEKPDIHV